MQVTDKRSHEYSPLDARSDQHSERSGRIAEEISIYALITPLSRRWRRVVGLPSALALVTAIIAIALPNRYTASTSFTAETGGLSVLGNLSGLAGLAGQLGVGGLSAEGTSPQFFAQVLTSRSILDQTLNTAFADPDSLSSGRQQALLIDILEIEGDSPVERQERGVKTFLEAVGVDVDKQTGIISLHVELPDATLAASVAARMVALLEVFNREQRQSQSRAQRLFTETRLTQARAELQAAEAAHLAFLERNRVYSDAPLLVSQEERLERAVQLKQELFVTLSRKYEEARIAEVQDTPVLTILDPPSVPFKKSSPRRALMVLAAIVLGVVIAVVTILVAEYLSKVRDDDHVAYETFLGARQSMVAEIRALIPIRRRA